METEEQDRRIVFFRNCNFCESDVKPASPERFFAYLSALSFAQVDPYVKYCGYNKICTVIHENKQSDGISNEI